MVPQLSYQIFDSLQAFCSSIAGLLSARAVMEGFGVGDENATSSYAVILKVAQDVTGRLATILFAWRYGTALEPEAKMYRLMADIVNDSATVLDCLTPALPGNIRILALCLSGCLRAICGVCAGGSKASLSVHFSKAGNIGELNAKDSSQETVVGLLGILTGSVFISHITSRSSTWITLLLLLAIHLAANYLAVRSIAMTTLNRQRATILYSSFRRDSSIARTVQTPLQVSSLEHIFYRSDALHDPLNGSSYGSAKVSPSLKVLLRAARLGSPHQLAGDITFEEALHITRNKPYFLWPQMDQFSRAVPRLCRILICFKDGVTAHDQLEAWLTSYELAYNVHSTESKRGEEGSKIKAPRLSELMQMAVDSVTDALAEFLSKAEEAGWDVNTGAIVTQTFRTISITQDGLDVSKKIE